MGLRCFVLCTCLAAANLTAYAGEPLIPIDAFVERQQFSHPRLSPDGKHVAVNARLKRGDRTIPTMTIYSLPELKIVSTIALNGYEIPKDFSWLNNRRLVVEKGLEVGGEREAPAATGEVVAVNLDGTKPEYLYGYKGFKLSSRGDRHGDDYGYGEVAHIPRARDGRVLLSTYLWDSKRSMLYDINSLNASRKLLADVPMQYMNFLVQNDATPRFSFGEDEDNQPVLFRQEATSGQWRRIDNNLLGAYYIPFAFTPDDSAVYASFSERGGPAAVVREDMKTGNRTLLAHDPLGDIALMQYSAGRIPFAFSTGTGIPKARYLDDTAPDAILHKTLSSAFPDSYVSFLNFTDDGQKLLFGVASDRDPGSFYLFDKTTGKADLLLTNMPQIDPALMAERRPVVFTARDGLQITGYITLPANPGKKKLPLVLLPHGGPFDVSDDWFFDGQAQFLASRGYAVLQVNFRGSSGRGIGFIHAGYREWGGKIINDLVDGVRWAAAQPDIDGARVCVVGGSFGGYAALMLPVREPSMFKCSVGYVGQYDLHSIYSDEGVKGNKRTTNFFIKSLGNDRAILEANSPTRLAEQIKIPVLLVHGDKDKITTLGQAGMMRDALIKAGRPPEWMLVKNEGHGFYDSENRKQFYQRLEAFLSRHIGQ